MDDPTAPFILTLDIGTSSLRAMLFDGRARAVAGVERQIKYRPRTTPDGGAELDAEEMFRRACRAIDRVLKQAPAYVPAIAAVGADSLVSNVLGVDAQGRAVTPVYTYADTRSAREVDELCSRMDEAAAHQRVGTRLHTSYLPARFLWLQRTDPELFARVHGWMSLGEYFYLRWLGQRACSYSVASWTGLLNRQALAWDGELLALLPVRAEQLSPLVDVTTPLRGLRNEYANRWPLLRHAVWFPAAGDGATANIGSGCVDATRIALTVGTSSAMRVTVPALNPPATVPEGLWSYRVDRGHELVGGALTEGGSLFKWMRETLRAGPRAGLEAKVAAMPPDSHGLTVLPFLMGERAPGWVGNARAAILGLSLNTKPPEIVRAGLEAVAYRLGLIFELLRRAAPDAREVVASGGALMSSPLWTQMIADVLGAPVIASAEPEATSRGDALLALQGLGAIGSLADLPAATGTVYQPDVERHEIYSAALKRQQKWYNLIIK